MKRSSLLLLLASVALWSAQPVASAPVSPAGQATGGRLIEIIGTDAAGKYLFKPNVINAKPGELLRVKLTSVAGTMGKMPKMAMAHNFVLLKTGIDPVQFANAGVAGGFAGSYIAPDRKDQAIASTPLAGVGESFEVSFKAPTAGTYPFICSFPGHLAGGMKGSLIVK